MAIPEASGAPPKAVANVRTGANPRGVAIVVPRAAPTPATRAVAVPRALTTGNNPRGVSLGIAPHAPTINDINARMAATAPKALKAEPISMKGFDAKIPTAAITGAAAIKPGLIGKIAGNLGKNIVDLPQNTVEGVVGLGKGVVKSVEAGSPSPLLHILGQAASSDPLINLLEGNFSKAGKLAEANPLNAGLDLAMGYGAAGRVAGAAAKFAPEGSALADAATAGAREARVAAPGLDKATVARGYSNNFLTRVAQQARDRRVLSGEESPLMKRARAVRSNHDLRLQVASMHAAKQGELAGEEGHIMRALTGAKPAGKEEAAIAPLVALTGGGRDVIHAIYDRMQRGDIPDDPDAQAARERMLKDLHAAILKDHAGQFDWGSTLKAAAAYKPLADMQETQKAVIDGRDVDQMARHLDNVRALRENDVHYLDKPVTDPARKQDLADAKAAQREATANLRMAERNRAAYAGTPEQRGAYRGASNAVSQLTKVIPVDPVTDTLMNHALDLRRMLDEQHPQLKAFHDSEVKLRKAELAEAKAATAKARADVVNKPLRGTVIEDLSKPQMRSGPLKGLSVRPLTGEDAAAIRRGERVVPAPSHAGETENVRVGNPDLAPDLQSYVSSRNPDRPSAQSEYNALRLKAGDQIATPAERGAARYTGESLNVGDMRSGWSSLPNTLLSQARRLSEAQETQQFFDRFELKNPTSAGNHEPWTTLADAKRAAQGYEQDHGLKMSVLEDKTGHYHVVPETAVRELNRQRALDHPGKAARYMLTGPNRIFRETVLPYSPKLPVMHTVENVSRTALNAGLNPLRTVQDVRLQRAVEAAQGPAARERLMSLAAPGSLSRSGVAGEAEDMGHLVKDNVPLAKDVVHKAVHFMSTVSTTIIRGQRWLEKGAQRAALGEHERTLLNEFGVSYRQAAQDMDTYAAKLADHLATPADAERAARSVHDAVGKYNAFTANVRLGMRVMPFGAWYVNAARLLYDVLPRDHPMTSALIQDTRVAQANGWAAQHKGLPGDLQDSLPVGNSAYLDIGKLTPIGLPGQSPATTLAQLTLPQYSSALLALGAGEDPFGAALKGPGTGFGHDAFNSVFAGKSPVAFGQALEQIAESMGGPLNDIARAIYGHGGVLYNESTPVLHLLSGGQLGKVEVKPGSRQDQRGILHLPPALDKVFDPFHPTTFHTSGAGNSAYGPAEGVLGPSQTTPAAGGLGKPEGVLGK